MFTAMQFPQNIDNVSSKMGIRTQMACPQSQYVSISFPHPKVRLVQKKYYYLLTQ